MQPTQPFPLRVVIKATFTSTAHGGEAILPWHYFVGLARQGIDAQLVTREVTRDQLAALEPSLLPRIHFVPDTALVRVLERVGSWFPQRLTALTIWPVMGMLMEPPLRRRTREVVWAGRGRVVVHQPAPVSARAPSALVEMGAPVVIGPLNGGMTYPPGFAGEVTSVERSVRWLLRIAADASNRLIPGKRDAALLLVANERSRAALPRSVRGTPVLDLVENGVDLDLFEFREHTQATRRFAYVGRLVEWKRVDLALEALARTPSDHHLEVCGDGPLRTELERLATSLGVADRVTFHGQLTQARCAEVLAGCDALVLPSVYESGGAVVLEAMACGLPVIATDWGGPADYVDEQTGVLVPPTSPEAVTAGFAAAMVRLAADPELARRMGRAGRAKVEAHYSWPAKIARIQELYAIAQS